MFVGYTFDMTGSYRLGFLFCLLASLAAWIALLMAKPIRAK
jgi:cyanate permease